MLTILGRGLKREKVLTRSYGKLCKYVLSFVGVTRVEVDYGSNFL